MGARQRLLLLVSANGGEAGWREGASGRTAKRAAPDGRPKAVLARRKLSDGQKRTGHVG